MDMKIFSPLHRLMFPCGFAMVASFASAADGGKGGPVTFQDFEKSAVSGAAVPSGLSDPLKALWHAKADQWDKSHEIAQDIKTPTGSWIHAFLHREEGDPGNAGYWYRRAGKTMPEGVTIAEEWSCIARELWHQEHGITPGEEVITSATGQVAMSEKPAGGEEGVWDTVIRKDGKVVLRIPNARPVSFRPAGDVLLLREAAADDDCRHFLVKPSTGAKVPDFGKRKSIGGRMVTGHKWSDDGRSLTLLSAGEGDAVRKEEIVVDEHVSSE
jgi:hypothetical protein